MTADHLVCSDSRELLFFPTGNILPRARQQTVIREWLLSGLEQREAKHCWGLVDPHEAKIWESAGVFSLPWNHRLTGLTLWLLDSPQFHFGWFIPFDSYWSGFVNGRISSFNALISTASLFLWATVLFMGISCCLRRCTLWQLVLISFTDIMHPLRLAQTCKVLFGITNTKAQPSLTHSEPFGNPFLNLPFSIVCWNVRTNLLGLL